MRAIGLEASTPQANRWRLARREKSVTQICCSHRYYIDTKSNMDYGIVWESMKNVTFFALGPLPRHQVRRDMRVSSNIAKYEIEIDGLIEVGGSLHNSMQHEVRHEEFVKAVKKQIGDAAAADFIKKLPKFSREYQSWYSEAKALVRQIIPDRLNDFVKHYERPENRKVLSWSNYTIEDYLQNIVRPGSVTLEAALPRMEQQLSILASAKRRFKSSLFDIKQLVAADIYDSEIHAAQALLKNKFFRAAGAVAGVVLEKHLAQVCENHSIKISKKNPTISDLNDLLKAADVIDVPRWRATQHLGDIRNLCDHNKDKEPTADQVGDLVMGVAKILKTLF